jgi:shikimate dehydrogenase
MPSDALLSDLRSIVANDLPARLPGTVAFIIGANPSKGARSPKLWNAAFETLGIDGEMFPLDVNKVDLTAVLEVLEADQRVVGAAVAAPYKADFAQLLTGRLSAAARHCGSINLMSREVSRSSGAVRFDGLERFTGSNTDGIAAVESLREVRHGFADAPILVLGCGGTGRAVIASLLNEVAPANLTVAIRSAHHHKWLDSFGIASCSTTLAGIDLSQLRVLINCTTIGWGSEADKSPLNEVQLASLHPDCTVFDVIYQPDPTLLLQRAKACGLHALSGSRMNLMQAVIAFVTANRGADAQRVAAAMQQAAA